MTALIPRRTFFCLLVVAAIVSGRITAGDDAPRTLRAGAATVNITPPLGELIVGGWQPFPATYVHDELHARCLVLDDGGTQVGFVVCDNVGIPREVFDAARAFIDEETEFPSENLLMSATHTHSATTARGESKTHVQTEFTGYQKFLARRIADAVRRALHNLEPARIGWGSVNEPSEVFNRRWYTTDPEQLKNPFGGVDKVRMNPPRGSAALIKPAGPTDPEVSFISVQSRAGRPIALLANYSLHYVGGVRGGGEISADYFAIFCDRIAELLDADKLSPPFVGILSNGTSGDVNNINFREKSPRYEPYEKMTEVAHKVAARVAEAHRGIKFHDWVPLGMRSRELTLKVRKPDARMQSYFAEVIAKPEGTPAYHTHERTYAQRVRLLAEGPEEVTVLLQGMRIGDLSIAAIPFEVFTEIGLEIKERTPFADTFTIELANGSYGYLPSPAQHELGGYETWMGTNNVELQASDKIRDVILDLFAELHEK